MNTILAQQIANEGGVEAWMMAQQHKSLLRFLTCGSVDDGKSTLIGRLLHDTLQIYEDQLSSLHNDSKRHGTQGEKLDLALLVDGLQAEREQGITIDVAYRYFSTEKRKFIIADTPGHEQYTRNMATGASTCDLAILLIDARKGVLDQTRRHSFISTLLGIKHLVVAINKMDLVDYREETFARIREDYLTFAEQLPGDLDIRFVPLSALEGDNVAAQSANMRWYSGPTLLEVLETVDIQRAVDRQPMRFPVQYVNRPNLDFRGMPALWRLVASKSESALKCCRLAWNPAWRVSSLLMATKKKPVRAKPLPWYSTTTLILAAAICCWRQTRRWHLRGTPRAMWYGWRNSRWRRAKATTLNSRVRKPARVSRLFAIRLISTI